MMILTKNQTLFLSSPNPKHSLNRSSTPPPARTYRYLSLRDAPPKKRALET